MLFEEFERRRRKLSMSYAALAQRCGVSMPTVVRILSGCHHAPAFNNVAAIAEALGLQLGLAARQSVANLQAVQAKRKAENLVAMLQGTSGLEGQGLDQKTLQRLRRQTARELLAGSKRNLW